MNKRLIGIISIKDIAIACVLGVSEAERSKPQTVFVSLDLHIDALKASESDNVKDTVNYRIMYEKIIEKVSLSKFHLLESLVSYILTICFEEDRVLKATVRVTKPNILEKAKGVSVEMSREKNI